jgi:Ca2+-binding RTX toxin-like protein
VTATDSGGLSHSQTVILRLSNVGESGGAGNDTLLGGLGGDTLVGKAGNDTYLVNSSGDVLVEKSSQGTDLANVVVASYTLAASVENLAFIGTGSFSGTGNSSNNVMTGGTGSDRLDGAGGNDTLNGGLDADTLIGGTGNDKLSGGDGVDLLQAGSGNDSLLGEAGNDSLLGQDGTDTLTGLAGADTLDGGAGNDKMLGGTGDDSYVVNSAGDLVTELAAEGVDTVASSITYTLGADLENLTLTGSGAINGTGNQLGNLIVGNAGANNLSGAAGNDMLEGGAGNDTLAGGAGADTYRFNLGGRQDTINNPDTDLAPDKLLFGAGIGQDDLWFTQSGSNLVLAVLGTSDKVTLSGWYSSASNQLDRVELSDGSYLEAADVQGLVNAMSFAPPPASLSALTAAQQQAVANAIDQSWQT